MTVRGEMTYTGSAVTRFDWMALYLSARRLPGGEVLTKPLTYEGTSLAINYTTSAAGSVRVELQDANGQPVPEFALADCAEIYGDAVKQQSAWAKGGDLAALAGPISLRIELRNADIYSFCFAKP